MQLHRFLAGPLRGLPLGNDTFICSVLPLQFGTLVKAWGQVPRRAQSTPEEELDIATLAKVVATLTVQGRQLSLILDESCL